MKPGSAPIHRRDTFNLASEKRDFVPEHRQSPVRKDDRLSQYRRRKN